MRVQASYCKVLVLAVCLVLPPNPAAAGDGQEDTKDLYLLGLVPMTGNAWPAGKPILTTFDLALEHVNMREDLLKGYTLKLHWADSKVGLILLRKTCYVIKYNKPEDFLHLPFSAIAGKLYKT